MRSYAPNASLLLLPLVVVVVVPAAAAAFLRSPAAAPIRTLRGGGRRAAAAAAAAALGASSLSSSDGYLSSLSIAPTGGGPTAAATATAEATPKPPTAEIADTVPDESSPIVTTTFARAPLSYFDVDKLAPKGPRKNADVGRPHDATRPLVTVGPASAGSWWCARGGWPSPARRGTTEVFYVLSGRGCVTDLDGAGHTFGPGDTVVLPKGWSGRWDVTDDIHKVWVVHDHPNIEETSEPIRAAVVPLCDFAPHLLIPGGGGERSDDAAAAASLTVYDVGPTSVGCRTRTPGSYAEPSVDTEGATVWFHVLEGIFFLTNEDGTAGRCSAGDSVVLPRGWRGRRDVIEKAKEVWVVAE